MSETKRTIKCNPDGIPSELRDYDQWVVWRLETREGKVTKVPYVAEPNLATRASATDPATWRTYEEAAKIYKSEIVGSGRANGIGFVFTDDDLFVFIDIDNVLDDGGGLPDRIAALLGECQTYAEWSQSGNGIHIIAQGTKPEGRNRTGNFEMYSTGRYVALTGEQVDGASGRVNPRQEFLDGFFNEFLKDNRIRLEKKPTTR